MPTVWPAALLLATETAQCSHAWLLLKKGPTRLDDCALPAWPPARRGTELLWRPWTTSLTKEAQPIRSLAKGYMARILLAFKESYNFYEKEPPDGFLSSVYNWPFRAAKTKQDKATWGKCTAGVRPSGEGETGGYIHWWWEESSGRASVFAQILCRGMWKTIAILKYAPSANVLKSMH